MANARDDTHRAALEAAEYTLRPGRSPEYVAFMRRLLCVDVAERYTAAQALQDPWILGEGWTAAQSDWLAQVVAALGSERARPSDYTEAEFAALVEELANDMM